MQKILLILTCYILTSCHNITSSEEAIAKLIRQYPQLATNGQGKTNHYTLERLLDDKVFKAELYTSDSSAVKSEKIIVITNRKNQTYAIPYFSFEETEYWNISLALDSSATIRKPISFESEIKKCNKSLGITKNDAIFALYVLRDFLGFRQNCDPTQTSALQKTFLLERHIKLWFTILGNADFSLRAETYVYL